MKWKIPKDTIIFLCIFLALFSISYFFINITLPNTMQRESAGMLLSQFISTDIWNISNFSDIIEIFSNYYNQYTIFTGFVEWPPLQISIFALMYLVFGLNQFTPYLFSVLSIVLFTLSYLNFFSLLSKNKLLLYGSLLTLYLNIFVVFSIFSTNIDFVQTALTLLVFYYFIKYIRTNSSQSFYIAALTFSIGTIYKFEMLIVGLPLLVSFILLKKKIKTYFDKKNTLMFLKGAAIFIFIFSIYLIPQLILSSYNLSPLYERTIGRFTPAYETDEFPFESWPIVFAEHYHFIREQPEIIQEAIAYRVDMPIAQRFILILDSLFHQWLFIPLFIFYLIIRLKKKKIKDVHLLSEITIASFIIIFSLVHFIPRYIIIVLPFLIFLSLWSIAKFKKKYLVPILILIIIFSLIQTISFLDKIEEGRHSTAHQHEFRQALEYVISISKGSDISIMTPWTKHIAHKAIPLDTTRNIYITSQPARQADFEALLNNETIEQKFLEEKNPRLIDNIVQKKIEFVFILEHFEIDSNPKNIERFNRKKYIETREDFTLIKTIEHKNSDIYIYQRDFLTYNRYTD